MQRVRIAWIFLSLLFSRHQSWATAADKGIDLPAFIIATGTLEPTEIVDVPCEVSGKVLSFGRDMDGKPVDYRSAVQKNQVLATIDPAPYESDLRHAAAELKLVETEVQHRRAELTRLQLIVEQAKRDLDQAPNDQSKLKDRYDLAVADLDIGKIAEAEAEAKQARSQVEVQRAKDTVGLCTILSPIDGVVIDRRIELGQKVINGLSSPSVFLIAGDLKKMVLLAPIDESQATLIEPGQKAPFTVDAFLNETFNGTVKKLRLNAIKIGEKVSYTVEIEVDNANGRLLPYLTAKARIAVATKTP